MVDNVIDPFQLLQEGVCCQQRTSAYKKFTVYFNDRIIKFPYTTSSAAALRDRFILLTGWEAAHLVIPKEFLRLSREMGSPEGSLAIEYANLGNLDINAYTLQPIQESFSNYHYQAISERKGLIKVSDLLREATKSKTAIREQLPQLQWLLDQATSVTTTLVKLTIAGVGDRGLYNVLANTTTHEVFCIDIEEDQSHLPNSDPWFYLTKPPAASFRDVWNFHVNWAAVIDNIIRTVPTKGGASVRLTMPCEPMLVSNTVSNYQYVLQLLQHMVTMYGQGQTLNLSPTYPNMPTTISALASPSDPTPLFNFVDSSNTNTIPSHTSSDPIGVNIMSHIAPELFTTPVTVNPTHPIGKMSYSFRHSTTYSGYADDEIRSGLQKYIRRGEVVKAIQCGYELYRMSEIHPEAKRLVTNLYNRLMVIATEDIGPGSVDTCMAVMEFVMGTKAEYGSLLPHQITAVIQCCAQSPKTRVLSHLWRVYAVPEAQAIAQANGIEIDPIQCTAKQVTWPGAPADHTILIHHASMFAERLSIRSPSAFTWLARYMAVCGDNTIKISTLRRRTNPIEALWVILEPYMSSRDYKILRDSYYHLSENRGCLMMAVYLVIWQVRSTQITTITTLADLWKDSPQLIQLQTGAYSLVLDEYVVDKHTKRGRTEGKDRTVFVNEGAVVHNRAPQFDDTWFLLLEKIYQIS